MTREMRGVERSPRPPAWLVRFDSPQPYHATWDLQKQLWSARREGLIPDTLLLLEHEPVVTLGKNARRENLLVDDAAFTRRGFQVIPVDRGGDVTMHMPGQLVGYWIFDLGALYLDVHRYLRDIEETLLRTLARFGIGASRSDGATGVWVEAPEVPGTGGKVAAIGLHLSRWISTHGFALNVSNDLAPFEWIVPCGLRGRSVTSVERLLAPRPVPSLDRVADVWSEELAIVFPREVVWMAPAELQSRLDARASTAIA